MWTDLALVNNQSPKPDLGHHLAIISPPSLLETSCLVDDEEPPQPTLVELREDPIAGLQIASTAEFQQKLADACDPPWMAEHDPWTDDPLDLSWLPEKFLKHVPALDALIVSSHYTYIAQPDDYDGGPLVLGGSGHNLAELFDFAHWAAGTGNRIDQKHWQLNLRGLLSSCPQMPTFGVSMCTVST